MSALPEAPIWRLAGGRTLDTSRPLVMGILNVTPDSFSDGGELAGDPAQALVRAHSMVDAGASLLDVGGESTRPGAARVAETRELSRVLPVIEALTREFDVPVSIDTRKGGVARAALDAGASIVNDVSGLMHDPELGERVAEAGAGLVLMHMRGEPETMMEHARYDDVLREIREELDEGLARARAAGVSDRSIVVDPGLGFAKTAEHNLVVLRGLAALGELGHPVLVGPSRKSFLGRVLDVGPTERVAGTVAACVVAYREGARVFRVHDVGPAVQALRVAEAIALGRLPEPVPAALSAVHTP